MAIVNFKVLSIVCRGANRFTCPNNPALLNARVKNHTGAGREQHGPISRSAKAAAAFLMLGFIGQQVCNRRSWLIYLYSQRKVQFLAATGSKILSAPKIIP